jgi:hypothetical protein
MAFVFRQAEVRLSSKREFTIKLLETSQVKVSFS